MKTAALILAGASAAALCASLAACVPPNANRPHSSAHLKAVAKLDCPDSQGELTRTSASPDGKTCSYAMGNDVVVQLKLTPISGDLQATLSPIEADLHQMAHFEPPSSSALAASSEPPEPDDRDHDHDHGRNGDVNINLPGIHIHANDDGRANVNVGGIHVDADDKTNTAHIEGNRHGFMGHGGGNFTIDANDDGAIIRSRSMGPDVHESLILASDKPGPEGWRAVGYEAQGPRSGPLVVAVVQSKSGEHDRLFEDVKALVRHTAGG